MVQLRPLIESDRSQVEQLITRHFSDSDSYTVVVNNEENGRYVRVAESDGEIHGVMAVTAYSTLGDVVQAMHLVDTAEPIPAAETYGLVHMGYVSAEQTGNGIGSLLLERLHTLGEQHGIDVFVSDAWFHGGEDTPEQLLTSHGYDVVFSKSIAGYADAGCTKCPGECVCEAALTVRDGSTPSESEWS